MTLTSKFDIGDKIWFFNADNAKFYEGTVDNIVFWNLGVGFSYNVSHNTKSETLFFTIEEPKMYASREEVLEQGFVYEDEREPDDSIDPMQEDI